MKVKFRKSETQKEHVVKLQAEGYYILDSHPNNWSEDCFVAVRKSAVDVVEDEPTYRIGQRFLLGYGEHENILARIDSKRVIFIGTNDGNRWGDPITVDDYLKVTKAEIDRLARGHIYKLV